MSKFPRNYAIAKGLMRWSRSQMYRKKGLFKIKDKKYGYQKANKTTKPVCTKNRKRETLKPTLTPGTVVIILAGPLRGRRAVFIKQLCSGLLLITGPYKVNGVPLRRINQAFCIATSTKVDLKDLKLPENINDAYFVGKKKVFKAKKQDKKLFEEKKKEKHVVSEERKKDQKTVDEQLLPQITSVPMLREYLAAPFTLKRGCPPHLIKF